MIELWTIYNTATGVIRISGSGPQGSGKWQQLLSGEALWLVASDPNKQKVATDASGHRTLVSAQPTASTQVTASIQVKLP